MPFLLVLLISLNSWAMSWNELQEGRTYKLNQDISLRQVERSGSTLEITSGEEFILKEMVSNPLPGLPYMLMIFSYQNCSGPQMRSLMEMISVHETSPVVKVGAQLNRDCELYIYFESTQYESRSLFQ
jgi:hypothetical protein